MERGTTHLCPTIITLYTFDLEFEDSWGENKITFAHTIQSFDSLIILIYYINDKYIYIYIYIYKDLWVSLFAIKI